jgi:hypothetical protein
MFLFLDTNVYLYASYITQAQHDYRLLSALQDALESSNNTLLLPEVVELEYRRLQREMLGTIRKSVDALTAQIERLSFPDYLSDERTSILRKLQEALDVREDNSKQADQAIDQLFDSSNIVRIPLSPSIMANAYRRALRGLHPFKPQKISGEIVPNQLWNADCTIVESLVDYVGAQRPNRLVFCTNNLDDFTEQTGKRKRRLHPDISGSFAGRTAYYRYLPDLLKSEFKTKVAKEEANKIQEAERAYHEIFADKSAMINYQFNTATVPLDWNAVQQWNTMPSVIGPTIGGAAMRYSPGQVVMWDNAPLERVRRDWVNIIHSVSRVDPPLGMLLVVSRPTDLRDGKLYLQFDRSEERDQARLGTRTQTVSQVVASVSGVQCQVVPIVPSELPKT